MRVVLAEDGALLREGLAGLLERFDYEVVAAVADAEAMVAAVDKWKPDVVVTDVRLPPAFTDEGLRAAVSLRARYPSLGVLVLSQYVAPTYATELLAAGGGGVGYLLKDRVSNVEQFLAALRRVLGGETVIDPEVLTQLLGNQRSLVRKLTAREREVLTLIAEGLSNAAIAGRLTITEPAVSKHIASILIKLGIPPDTGYNRRVLAVLSYLRSQTAD